MKLISLKYIFFFSSFSVLFLSCTQKSDNTNDIFQTIVEDNDYIKFRESFLVHQENILSGVYNIQELNNFLDEKGIFVADLCNKDLSLMTQVKGGVEYAKAFCEYNIYLEKIEKKYQLSSFDNNDLNKLNSLYDAKPVTSPFQKQ